MNRQLHRVAAARATEYRRRTVLIVAVVVASLSTSACYRHVRANAPPMPARLLPAIDLSGVPAPGLTRLVLDSPDGPATVERLRGGTMQGVAGTLMLGGSLQVATNVCVTPCVVDMPPGNLELRFTAVNDSTRTSTGFVNLDQQTTGYRHAVGTQRNRAWRGFAGWPLLVIGALSATASAQDMAQGSDRSNMGSTLVIGGLLAALGGWLVYTSTIEDQAGTGVQWHP